MRFKLSKRICALFLAGFLLLGTIPAYGAESLDATGELPDKESSSGMSSSKDESSSSGGLEESSRPQDGGEPGGSSKEEGNPGEKTAGNEDASSSDGQKDELDRYIITQIIFDAENARVTMPVGTNQEDLELPAGLETVAATSSGEPFNGLVEVEWLCEDFDSEKAGEYVFTAVMPQGWTLDDEVFLPQITVELVAPVQSSLMAPFALNNFDLTYKDSTGAPAAVGYTTFVAAWNAVNALSSNITELTIEMNANGTFSGTVNTLNKPCIIQGNGNNLTVDRAILTSSSLTFKDITVSYTTASASALSIAESGSLTVDNAHFVLNQNNSRIQTRTMHVAGPSSITKPNYNSSSLGYYVWFISGGTTRPLTGGELTLKSGVYVPANYANGQQLVSFASNVGGTLSAMLAQVVLDSGSFDPVLFPVMFNQSGPNLPYIGLSTPPIMVTYKENGVQYLQCPAPDEPDPFGWAVNYVNTNLRRTGVTDITIGLRQDMSTNGTLPLAECTVTSNPDTSKYTLTSSSAFTLNNKVQLRNITLASSTSSLNVNCGAHTLSVHDGVTLPAAQITGASGTSGTLEVWAPVSIKSTNIGKVSVNCSNGAASHGLTVADTLISRELQLAAAATATAPVVSIENTLTLGSGAIIEAPQVDAGTLDSDDGIIVYPGNTYASGQYILGVKDMTSNCKITISAPQMPPFATGHRIIRVEKPKTIETRAVTLYESIFDNFALELDDTTDPTDNYYILKEVAASVTYNGHMDKYTTLTAALVDLDKLIVGSGRLPELHLWKNAVLTGGSFPASTMHNACIMFGHAPDDDSGSKHTLSSGTSSITLNQNVKFQDIILEMGGVGELNANRHTLTMGTNATFDANPNVRITGDDNSSFVSSGAEFTCGTIDGFGSISFIGSKITLGQLVVPGSLSAGKDSTLTFKLSGTTPNIVFTNNPAGLSTSLAGFSGLTVNNSSTTTIGDRFIQIPGTGGANILAYKQHAADKIDFIGNYSGKTLRSKKDSGIDYFVLSAPVGQVSLTSSENSRIYGEPLSFTATLKDASDMQINDWEPEDGAKVEFYVGSVASGNKLGEVSVDTGSTNNGTATLAVTHEMYRSLLNAASGGYLHTVIAAFYNQPGDRVDSNGASITVNQKEVGVTCSSIGGSLGKVYDRTTDMPANVTSAHLATFLTLTAGDILPAAGEKDIVTVTGATAEFTDYNAGTGKHINFTGITLGGAHAVNYKLPTTLTQLEDVTTTSAITPKPLSIGGTTSITKEYDGTTNVNYNPASDITLQGVVSGDTVAVTPINPRYTSRDVGSRNIDYDGWEFSSATLLAISNNYSLPAHPGTILTGNITPRELTFVEGYVGGTGPVTKVYDGNNQLLNPETQIEATNVQGVLTLAPPDDVEVYVKSATFSRTDVPLSTDPSPTVTAVFGLRGTDAGNYTLPVNTKTLTGRIDKALVAQPPVITIQIPLGESLPPAHYPYPYPLNNIVLVPNPSHPGMEPGNVTYSVGTPTVRPFFSIEPHNNTSNDELEYEVEPQGSADMTGSNVIVAIDSQNYEPTNVTFHFIITSKTVLDITGVTPPGGKTYNGDPIGTYSGTPVFTEQISGDPYVDSPIVPEYWYTDENNVRYDNAPTEAGTYTLWACVPDDNTLYMGQTSQGTVEITRRGLVINPKSRTIDLGDPMPSWNTFDDFDVVATPSGNDGFVVTSLSSAFGDGQLCPFVLDSLPDPNKKTAQTLTIDASVFPVGSDVGRNYKIDGYQTGTLTINGDIEAGWIEFTPPAPDGENGWYKTAITAESKYPAFPYIGPNRNGPFALFITLNDESAVDVAPPLYLSDGQGEVASNPGQLVTSAYTDFTYRLDTEAPTLGNVRFEQNGANWGTLYVEATDLTSGIADGSVKVALTGATPRNNTGVMHHEGGGVYSCVVDKGSTNDFTYVITAKDNAGWITDPAVTGGYTFFEVTGIKVSLTPGGDSVSSLRMEINETVDLYAEIESNLPGPTPGVTLFFDWGIPNVNGSAPATITTSGAGSDTATVKALIPVPPELGSRATLFVSAMGAEARVDISFYTVIDPDDVTPPNPPYPGAVVPNPSVPYGNSSDIVLVIEQLESGAETSMKNSMQSSLSSLLSGYPNWKLSSNSRWFDIWLMDTSTGKRVIPTGDADIGVYLPYQTGTSAANDFLLIHQYSGSLNNISLEKSADGISFSVDSLSPFTLIWKKSGSGGEDPGKDEPGKNKPSGNNRNSKSRNGSSSSGTGSSGQAYDDFWSQVRKAITAAKPGDLVRANVPAYINTCPVSVLQLLKGKDVTLSVTWQGENVLIYGKDVNLPDPLNISFYYLKDLFEMYAGLRPPIPVDLQNPYDLQNPETGGDGIMLVAPNGEALLTLPAAPENSLSASVIPSPGDSFGLPNTPNGPGASAGEEAAMLAKTRDMGVFVIVLIVLLMAMLAFTRKNAALRATAAENAATISAPARPNAAVTAQAAAPRAQAMPAVPQHRTAPAMSAPARPNAAAQHRTAPAMSAPARPNAAATAQAAAPRAQAMPAVPQHRTAPAMSAPARPNAAATAQAAAPRAQAMPAAPQHRAAPARTQNRETDRRFFSIIEQHKLLKVDFENGVITREEYEAQKRRLMCS